MVNSLNNERIKEYAKLHSKKYRDEKNMFIVEGEHLVEEAIKYAEVVEIFSLDERDKITRVSEAVMAKLSELKTVPTVLAVLRKIDKKEVRGNLLILDNIQDPGNLGTIIRSAVAFNVDTIVLSEDSVDEYNSKVLRASEGMVFHINIVRCNIEDLLRKIKDKYLIMTTDVNNGVNITDIEVSDNYALIMGNEGNGVREELNDLADKKVYIDMNSKCESLNVGVATSILLYELAKSER